MYLIAFNLQLLYLFFLLLLLHTASPSLSLCLSFVVSLVLRAPEIYNKLLNAIRAAYRTSALVSRYLRTWILAAAGRDVADVDMYADANAIESADADADADG